MFLGKDGKSVSRKAGKVVQVYRKKWCIYLDKHQREKQNGQHVFIPVKPSNCVIEKLHLNKDRKELLARRAADKDKTKGKYTAKNMKNVD